MNIMDLEYSEKKIKKWLREKSSRINKAYYRLMFYWIASTLMVKCYVLWFWRYLHRQNEYWQFNCFKHIVGKVFFFFLEMPITLLSIKISPTSYFIIWYHMCGSFGVKHKAVVWPVDSRAFPPLITFYEYSWTCI